MSKPTRSAILDLNLLPASKRPADVSPLAAVFGVFVAVAVVGLIPLSLRANDARDQAAAVTREADAADAQVRSLQVDLSRIRALRIELEQTRAEQQVLDEELAALRGGRRPLGDDLGALWDAAATQPQVSIQRVSGALDGLIVTGLAPGPLEAIAYADALSEDGPFAEARLATFAPGAGGGGFTIEVTR